MNAEGVQADLVKLLKRRQQQQAGAPRPLPGAAEVMTALCCCFTPPDVTLRGRGIPCFPLTRVCSPPNTLGGSAEAG